jgi:hypothetical protein
MVELVRAGRSPDDLAREFEPTAQSIRNWPVAIMPVKCRTTDEWLARYAPSDDPREKGLPTA